jgi:acid phosphatase type 7
MTPRSARGRGSTRGAALILLAVLGVGVVTVVPSTAMNLRDGSSAPTGPGGAPVVAAAGDVACDPADPSFNDGKGKGDECRALSTKKVLEHLDPTAVLALGDLQYTNGAYSKFLRSYALSWGLLGSITHPVPGNHEYLTSEKAGGYFRYFHGLAGKKGEGYYSYDLGSWHLIALNSECFAVACAKGSAQYEWLKADLAASAAECTLAYWHEPRFSSGPHGGTIAVLPFWRLLYRGGADVVLSAHDHIYERFLAQGPTGVLDPAFGITEFVVGTGGAEQYPIEDVQPNSARRRSNAFGVLRLRLRPASFRWRFVATPSSSFTDSGSTTCHGIPA